MRSPPLCVEIEQICLTVIEQELSADLGLMLIDDNCLVPALSLRMTSTSSPSFTQE